jgi:signal transduction histidine kinase
MDHICPVVAQGMVEERKLLRTSTKQASATSRRTLQAEGREAVLRIRDNGIGIGIAPELLPHIFELFTQAEPALNRSQGGLGIGLSLVQRLVKLHGGSVQAQSIVDKRGLAASC